jgi:hypothetical protein
MNESRNKIFCELFQHQLKQLTVSSLLDYKNQSSDFLNPQLLMFCIDEGGVVCSFSVLTKFVRNSRLLLSLEKAMEALKNRGPAKWTFYL